jgi:hypothetical protein
MMNRAEALCRAVCKDDLAAFRDALNAEPELKKRINDPIGAFDSPW